MDNFEKNYTAEELKEVEEWISRNIGTMINANYCQSIEDLSRETSNYFNEPQNENYLRCLCLEVEETLRMRKKFRKIMSGGKCCRYEVEVIIKEKEKKIKNIEED